jgi:hypothetical protein
MPFVYWLKILKEENFKLKIIFFTLLKNSLHKLQCYITIFVYLNSAPSIFLVFLIWVFFICILEYRLVLSVKANMNELIVVHHLSINL